MFWKDEISAALAARDSRLPARSYLDRIERLALECTHWREGDNGGDGSGGAENAAAWTRARVDSLEGAIERLRATCASLSASLAESHGRRLALESELRTLARTSAQQRHQLEELRTLVLEKDRQIQVGQDDLALVQLEQTVLERRLEDLAMDNKTLLARWIEAKNQEVERMNQEWLRPAPDKSVGPEDRQDDEVP